MTAAHVNAVNASIAASQMPLEDEINEFLANHASGYDNDIVSNAMDFAQVARPYGECVERCI